MKEKKRKRKKPVFIALCAVLAILIAMFVFFPPSAGKLPGRGAGGIAERTQVATDDGNLDIILLSDDISNPVLMVCGGGPGIPQYLLESMYPSALPEVFTVCYWDYRGTGASYSSDAETVMTTQRYIKDALAVTDYLSDRFSNDKIFILGHSFGTYIALKTVQAYPERYSCYIAMSQIVDQKQSEYLAFDYMKEQYEAAGNAKMTKQFDKYDIRASQQDYDNYFFSGLRDDAMHDLGVGTTRSMRSVISGIFFPSLRCTAYTQKERINIWRGKAASRNYPVTKDAIVFNAATDVPKLDVPVCFIAGKYDYTCCFSLQREYCEFIEVPEKTMYVFENSAHSPVYEEYEEGKRVLTEIRNTYRHQLRSAGDQ